MQSVATAISGVTVYRNGALVVRQGRGRGEIEVAGLPLLFASDTLRVRPERGAVRDLEETVRTESAPAPIPVSEDERARMALDVARVDDELRACALVLEVLAGMAPELPDATAPPAALVDAKLFVELVGFAYARTGDVAARRAELQKRRRALEEERRRTDERAAAIPDQAPRVLRGARFTLDVDDAAGFALEYFVPAARWVPTYALHLASGRARLVTAALVAQASGEDWTGAALSVCTADLARESTLPTLSSWRIGRAQPERARAFRPLPTDLPSLFFGYDRAPRRPSGEAKKDASRPPPPPQQAPSSNAVASTIVVGESSVELGEGGVFLKGRAGGDEDTGEFDLSADSEELRSFEKERSSDARVRYEPKSAFDDDDAPTAVGMPRAPADALMVAMESAQRPSAPAAMMAPKKAGIAGFGGGRGGPGGSGGPTSGVQRARSELPTRWRTAYMRMVGADEGQQRGCLVPLDPVARLAWLLEAHDVDADQRGELRRAVQVLQQAQARLQQQPLPRGTSQLGTHFPSIMSAASPTDVPGDGTFYRVEVRADEGPAATEHRCVPRESNDVWRTCKLDVKGAPLPTGPLVVYEDGAFKVNARLDGSAGAPVAGGTAVSVNLGVDPDMRVLSRTVHVNQSEKGLVTSLSRVEHKIKIEVRSTKKEPASVVIHDRLPAPAENVKDVTVNVLDERPPIKRTQKDAQGNEVTGAFEWRAVLMPGDTQTFELAYAIDLPAKAELEGGNRRE